MTTYENCHDVYQHGRHDILKGQDGYAAKLDGDGDGVACELSNAKPGEFVPATVTASPSTSHTASPSASATGTATATATATVPTLPVTGTSGTDGLFIGGASALLLGVGALVLARKRYVGRHR